MVERITELCKKNGISISKLEQELGLSKSSIAKWSKSVPSCDKLKAVADYFGVSMEYLMTGNERPDANNVGYSQLDNSILDFVHALPVERLRGILLALEALKEILDALDRAEPIK